MATVAVIMRTKDRPLLLARAVADVCAQTFADWHLVVVNDGGDVTAVDSVIGAHEAALGGRVTVIRNHVSQGMEAASNQGIKASNSAYIAIHDDDDTWHPEFLTQTAAHLESAADAAVAVRTELVWEHVDGDEIIEQGREVWAPDVRAFTLFDMLRYNRVIPISVLYRRAVHDEIGWYREDLPAVGDWEFWLRLAQTEHTLGFIDAEPLAFWRQRRGAQGALANSVIARDADHRAVDLLVRDEALRTFARQYGVGDLLYLTKYIQLEADRVIGVVVQENRQLVGRVARLEAAVSDASLVSLARRRYRRLKARLSSRTPSG